MNICTLAPLSCSEVSIGYLETENFSKMLSWHMKRLRVGFKTYLIMAHNWLKTEGSRWSFFKNFRCCMWVGWLKQSPPPPPLWSAPLCNEERLQSSSTCLKFLPVVHAAPNRSEVSGGRPVGASVQRGRRLLTRYCEFVLPAPPRHLQSLTY